MNQVYILAETPRAGRWNHRFLAASDALFSEQEISKLIGDARQNLQGQDYIAVSQETHQSESGRTGAEILLIAGIKHYTPDQREYLRGWLQQKLPALETLVTQEIDWDAAKQLCVRHTRFTEWEHEVNNMGLPGFSGEKRGKELSSNPLQLSKPDNILKIYLQKLWKRRVMMGIISTLVVFVIFSVSNITPTPPPTHEEPGIGERLLNGGKSLLNGIGDGIDIFPN